MDNGTPHTPEENANKDMLQGDIKVSEHIVDPHDAYSFKEKLINYMEYGENCPNLENYASIAKALVRSKAREYLNILKPLVKKAYFMKDGKIKRPVPFSTERILRYAKAFACYDEYFNLKKTSSTADKLSNFMKYFSIPIPESKITRIPLYTFDNFYRPEGDVKIAIEMERIRALMLKKSKRIHELFDTRVKEEIEKYEASAYDEERKAKKGLASFLSLPSQMEVRNLQIEEIGARFRGRNAIEYTKLNKPPKGAIMRIATQNCEIEGMIEDKCLNVISGSFDPSHLITYALNANLKNEYIMEQSKEWFDFSQKVFGSDGVLRFYEFLGYMMVTSYPLPTERSIGIILGDPGSGKGTHLAAVQSLLTIGTLQFFAKAGPHKFTNPAEHFSFQNLSNKLLITLGDIKHQRIQDFAAVNDLLGGEPAEMEKKFRDPSTEIPIFKALWGSTYPLFPVTRPGGLFRRAQFFFTQQVTEEMRDESLKPKLFSMLDGFFFNALLGLSRLAMNNWKFTHETMDGEIEKLWAFHSNSIRVWAKNLNPEDENVEVTTYGSATLDGNEKKKDVVENVNCRMLVDDLYNQYSDWCKKKQIDVLGAQTFSNWLHYHDFIVKKKVIEDGVYKGQRKRVVYASWNDKSDDDDQTITTEFNLTFEDMVKMSPIRLDGKEIIMPKESEKTAIENEPVKETKKEELSPKPEKVFVRISLIDDVPPLAWSDGVHVFHKHDIADVPEDMAEFLIKRGDAYKIEEGKAPPKRPVFRSVKEAEDAITSHGLEITEASWIMGEKDVRKFKIKGMMVSRPMDVQQFLRETFMVKYEGSEENKMDYTILWSKIERRDDMK